MKGRAALLILLALAAGATARTSGPHWAAGVKAGARALGCPSWIEVTSQAGNFSVRFPSSPKQATGKFPDGKKWDMYLGGEGDKLLSVDFRRRKSGEPKWSQIIIDDLAPRKAGGDLLRRSVCIFNGYSALEEEYKVGAGYYARDLRISTDEYYYSLSFMTKKVEELDSDEAQCFFDSFKFGNGPQ